jgi:hypothetical protein
MDVRSRRRWRRSGGRIGGRGLERSDDRHSKDVLIVPESILLILIKVDLDTAVDLLDEELADVPNDSRFRRVGIGNDVKVGKL